MFRFIILRSRRIVFHLQIKAVTASFSSDFSIFIGDRVGQCNYNSAFIIITTKIMPDTEISKRQGQFDL